MDDKRATDRRKTKIKPGTEKRKGPRRLVCACGGRIDIKLNPGSKESFECLRCGKKQ